jgi:hypothetical protein
MCNDDPWLGELLKVLAVTDDDEMAETNSVEERYYEEKA